MFLIDASKGFIKDGPKNRLREQDIHRIVDTFARQVDVPRYARMDHRRITLSVRPGSDRAKREAVMHQWHKRLLHEAVPRLIHKWEPRLHVRVAAYFLQRMKEHYPTWREARAELNELQLGAESWKEYAGRHPGSAPTSRCRTG